jgi:hypothetical protein
LVPDPGSSGGTSRYLREDGQWMPSTPGGTAGGDLTGSFPNPTIGIGAITDSKVASVAYSKLTGAPASLPPSGSAGGDLVGSYPNPTMKNTGTAGTYTKVTTDAQGRVTTGTTLVAADLPVFIGSGATHAQGAVPDAGATPGTLKFLREDGGWQVPPGVSEVENAVVAGHTTIAPSGDAVYTAIHAAAQFVAANLFNVNTNSHTVGASERRLFVSFNGAVAITLPVPTILATFEIIDTLGAARETNPITLLQNAAESIGGVPAARKLRTPFGRWTVTTDGSNWWL